MLTTTLQRLCFANLVWRASRVESIGVRTKENLMRLPQKPNSHTLVSTIIDWRVVHYASTCVQQVLLA